MRNLSRVAVFSILVLTACPAYSETAEDYLRPCMSDSALCQWTHDQFKVQYPKALKGDYQSQRNVAYSLTTGGHGAVVKTPPLGCAWRIVIQASGNPKVDATDAGNFRVECGSLDALGRATAVEQAKLLFRKIYGRALPSSFQ